LLRDDERGTVVHLDGGTSPLLGAVPRRPVSEERLELAGPSTIVAYTDGLVEQREHVIDEGIARLETALRSVDPGRAPSAVADLLLREVAGTTAVHDDIALLVLRYAGVPSHVDIELPRDAGGLARTRSRLARWLDERGVEGAARSAADRELDAAFEDAAGAPADETAPRLQLVHADGAVEVTVAAGVAPIVS
jgi:hypothetical protein